MNEDVDALMANPLRYLKSLNFQRHEAIFVDMALDDFAASPFLDHRIRASGPEQVLPLQAYFSMAPEIARRQGPIRFIFHIGHCGSTLISRLLGALPGALALREPDPMRMVATLARNLGTPSDPRRIQVLEAIFSSTLALMSRPAAPGGPVFVKPPSIANVAIGEYLGAHPCNRAILLWIGLEDYLRTMAKPENQRETNQVFAAFHAADLARWTDADLAALDVFQKTAAVWAVNMQMLLDAAANPVCKGRVSLINFNDFLANRGAVFQAILKIFELSGYTGHTTALLADPALNGRYSKVLDEPFDAALRADALARAGRAHGAEIAAAMRWLRAVIEQSPKLRGLSGALD